MTFSGCVTATPSAGGPEPRPAACPCALMSVVLGPWSVVLGPWSLVLGSVHPLVRARALSAGHRPPRIPIGGRCPPDEADEELGHGTPYPTLTTGRSQRHNNGPRTKDNGPRTVSR